MPSETGRTVSYGSDRSYSIEKVADDILRAAHQNSEITIDKMHIHVSQK